MKHSEGGANVISLSYRIFLVFQPPGWQPSVALCKGYRLLNVQTHMQAYMVKWTMNMLRYLASIVFLGQTLKSSSKM